MSIPKIIRILLIEDNAVDALLLTETFAELSDFDHELTHVERLSDGMTCISSQNYHVVLLDLALPDSQGMDTFLTFHHQAPELPVLVLTALDDVSVGLRAMQEGAQDYLIKGQVQAPLLGRAIRYAIERHHFQMQLENSRDRLRLLATRLQVMREDERTRISREIHDEFGQKLTALKMDLRWVGSRLAPSLTSETVVAMCKRVHEAAQLTDTVLEAVQRIAIQLRPSVLDQLGLSDAIRDEARRFEGRTGLHMVLDLPQEFAPLNEDIATTFFRIFQELLTNIARHAQAKTVTVQLGKEAETLVMNITDDGIGMPADAVALSTSLGLLGMQERAAAHQGQIQFGNAPGRGTRATVRIPAHTT